MKMENKMQATKHEIIQISNEITDELLKEMNIIISTMIQQYLLTKINSGKTMSQHKYVNETEIEHDCQNLTQGVQK
jgi:hypothetical protein